VGNRSEAAAHLTTEAEGKLDSLARRADAVLMGRKTYEVAAAAGQGAGYPGVANYVFSRTLTTTPAGVTLVRDDAAGFVRQLKGEPGKEYLSDGWRRLRPNAFRGRPDR
jgi:dihydrofolate reductase